MSKEVYRNSIRLPLCIIAFFCVVLYGSHTGASASTYVQGMTDGINLGNTYETEVNDIIFGDEEAVATVIDNILSNGYTTVRIPVTLSGHFDEETGAVQEDFYEMLSPVIDYALNKDMNVILTMYGDSLTWLSDMEDSTSVKKLYKKVWKDIAKHYKTYSSKLSFEGADAPYYDNMEFDDQLSLLDEMNKAFVDAVRATGGKNKTRPLFVSTLNARVTVKTCKSMVSFIDSMQDENLVVSIHYYGLQAFSKNYGGVTTFTDETKQDIIDFFKCVNKYFIANNIPVVCTEYGLYGQASVNNQINHGEMLKYFEYLTYAFKKYEIPALLWDDGSLYNRINGEWHDEELGNLLMMERENRCATIKRDTVFLTEESKSKDTALTLALHGAKVTYVEYESRCLNVGEEYRLEENMLMLTSAFISPLYDAYAGEHGQIATLKIYFDKGCPVTVYLKITEKKELASSISDGEEMVIPVKFKGDTLTSMEAVNESGKPVGPEKDTTYQEFNYAFVPDYENDTITLTEEFLEHVEESQVTLTFHFLSGDQETYTIVRDGNNIKEINYQTESEEQKEPVTEPEVTATPAGESAETITIDTGEGQDQVEIPLVFGILVIGAVAFLGGGYYLYRRRKDEEHYLPPDQRD